jgi:Dienelactone hydrolase family
MVNPHIQLTTSDGHTFDAYVAEPATYAASAVVVLQEIFGVNRHIRSVVDDYASQGFLALAPALFDRVQPGIELAYNSTDAARGMQLVTQMGMEKPLLRRFDQPPHRTCPPQESRLNRILLRRHVSVALRQPSESIRRCRLLWWPHLPLRFRTTTLSGNASFRSTRQTHPFL